MAPFADAVRFVDGQENDPPTGDDFAEIRLAKSLGRNVEQIEFAVT